MKIRVRLGLIGFIIISISVASCAVYYPSTEEIVAPMKAALVQPFIIAQVLRWGTIDNTYTPYATTGLSDSYLTNYYYNSESIITILKCISNSTVRSSNVTLVDINEVYTNSGYSKNQLNISHTDANGYSYTAAIDFIFTNTISIKITNIYEILTYTNNDGTSSATNTIVTTNIATVKIPLLAENSGEFNTFLSNAHLVVMEGFINYKKDLLDMNTYFSNYELTASSTEPFFENLINSFSDSTNYSPFVTSSGTIGEKSFRILYKSGFKYTFYGTITNTYEIVGSGGGDAYVQFDTQNYYFKMLYTGMPDFTAQIPSIEKNMLPSQTVNLTTGN